MVLESQEPDAATLRVTAGERANALREAVALTDWERFSGGLAIAVSVGVAAARLGPQAPGAAGTLYREADAELYVDKASREVA